MTAHREARRQPATTAHLAVGTQSFPIEADRIHVVGSGDRADVRIVHASVAPAHVTLCAHDGRLLVQDLGDPRGTWLGDEPIVGEREVPSGSLLRIGAIPVRIAWGSPVPVVIAPVPSRGAQTAFAELMAEELRRAPWLGLSLLVHGVLLLLLYVLVRAPDQEQRPSVRLDFGPTVTDVDVVNADDDREPEIEVTETPDPTDLLPDVPVETIAPAPLPDAKDAPPLLDGVVAPGVSLFARIGGANGEGDLLGGGGQAGELSEGFRRTVAGLRESGLEIVFVVDSTGSMGPVLEATKRRMVRMLEALHAMVPDARVGIVTYRDRGANESYVTRELPLDLDLYRALNFMQSVQSGGGGDRPEAVLDGLRSAIEQPWRPGARRVVVVVGDAPAQPRTEEDINRLVARFVKDGRSFVHTIMTSTDLFGSVSGDTKRSFERIAVLGRGICVPNEREETILQEVLSLAIGTEHRQSIDEVFRIMESRAPRLSARARDAIRRADPVAIASEMQKPHVDDAFVAALVAARSRELADALIEVIRSPDLPDPGRQATAYALQRMLSLREPPIDPLAPRPVSAAVARELRVAAAGLR